MNKRTARKLAAIFTAALIALLQAVPAFAEMDSNGAVVSTGETDVEAAITKVLETGETTVTPNAQFTFTFEQIDKGVSITNLSSQFSFDEAVTMSDVDVPIPAKTVSVNGMTGTTTGGKKIIEVQTQDIFSDVTYERAGIYKYKVKETSGTYNITDTNKEKMNYSTAEYEMYVYVANKAAGGVYIKAVGVVLTQEDVLNTNTGDDKPEVGSKIDPTPNPDPSSAGEVSADNSDMKFYNTYLYTPGGGDDPTDPDNQTLQIGKNVTGSLGDKDRYFDFSVSLKKPLVDTETTSYEGYVVDANNNIVTSADNGSVTDGTHGKCITFTLTNGEASGVSVKLKHGQRLVFSDVSVGTHFAASETAVSNYRQILSVTTNNTTSINGANTGDTGDQIVGNPANTAAFTNEYKDVTPMGIIRDHGSLLAVLALIALIVLGNMYSRRVRQQAR